MDPMREIGVLVVQSLGTLYLFTVVLRFLLQQARADFYNPVSQFVVKATNPLLIPLRRVIPGVGGIDVASIVPGTPGSLFNHPVDRISAWHRNNKPP